LPRGGSYFMGSDLFCFGLGLGRRIVIVAVLPSPNEGEGLGVRSAICITLKSFIAYIVAVLTPLFLHCRSNHTTLNEITNHIILNQ
jgi:hypothetical protein